MRIDPAPLERFAGRLLEAAGIAPTEAAITAEHLVDANLAGHDSHGAMRLLQYLREIDAGTIVPGSRVRVLADWPTGAVIDARGLLGQVAGHDAMQRALDKARATGLGAATLRHANHSGRLGSYVEQAARAGMIGIAMANGGGGGQWVAPFGGRERRLSTNPIAIGAPSAEEFPYVLDISTSIAPEGKVRDCLQRAAPTPPGWLVDERGEPTTDPQALYGRPGGALLPFGGPAGHKGFGLAFMVDVFAGALSGAACPTFPRQDADDGTGLFVMAINVAPFIRLEDFLAQVDGMSAFVKSSAPAAGFTEVLAPGEYEHRQRQRRRREGIELPDAVVEQLRQHSGRLGLSDHEVPFS